MVDIATIGGTIYLWLGLILSMTIFWFWMLVDMVKYKKFSGGAKFGWFLLFLIFSPLAPIVWFFALKKNKLRTFFILLIIFVVLVGGGWLIGNAMA